MLKYFKTRIGRLRLLGFLEGMSLIALVCLAVPLKYLYDAPEMVQMIGPIHGILFILFVFATFSVSIEYKWSFSKITWKVLLSCLIPFANFYVDRKILKGMEKEA